MGGLDEKITEALMWELFLQAGPVGEVHVNRHFYFMHAMNSH